MYNTCAKYLHFSQSLFQDQPMSIINSPTYNLKVVIKETGIAADTLRAWERRYGLPMPERSPGGHRLYSQRDIEIVKWLMAKQREGMSISRAVDLWNDLSASGEDSLSAPTSETLPTRQTASISSANLDAVRNQWLEACLVFNENSAEQVINQAFALYPLETVCIEVLQKGLIEIGDLWYHGQVTIQQEHFTSALAQRRLDALIAATPPPTRPETVLIGCTTKEQHTFPPLLLTLLLRRRGLKVVYLGANVPNHRFKETLLSIKPHLVILSAQLLQTANELRETASQLTANGACVAYGGRIFNILPELRSRIPAHFLGETLLEAVQTTETLLSIDVALSTIEPVSTQEKSLSESFARNQPMIDVHVFTETIKVGISPEYATIAIQELGNSLRSALSFGNIEALGQEMDWITWLLKEHNQRAEHLGVFLNAYANAVDSAMGEEGQLISSWIRSQAN